MYDIDLKAYIRKKNLTQKQFAELTGIDIYQLSRIVTKKIRISNADIEKIRAKFPDFHLKEFKEIAVFDDIPQVGEEIPIYDAQVYGTISPSFDDHEILLPIALRKIPLFAKADGAVQVRGHSMKGYINNGDWIVIKRIMNKELIIYGEPYLVITKTDNYRTVKFLKESMDSPKHFTLVPYNIEQFEPQDIPKTEVLELYAILGLFRAM